MERRNDATFGYLSWKQKLTAKLNINSRFLYDFIEPERKVAFS